MLKELEKLASLFVGATLNAWDLDKDTTVPFSFGEATAVLGGHYTFMSDGNIQSFVGVFRMGTPYSADERYVVIKWDMDWAAIRGNMINTVRGEMVSPRIRIAKNPTRVLGALTPKERQLMQ
jgi:hypothetical protein